ncbi:MAG: hypothetical protein IH608_11270, partial [Proteobacteria bacterium]|nr:hypothetical protein [Pseudomonadota bacterium]
MPLLPRPAAGAPAREGVFALAAACWAITWPGALIFGYPGVMSRHWQESLGLGRAAVGA